MVNRDGITNPDAAAFAGMLTFNDSKRTSGTEQVILEYSKGGGKFASIAANALFGDSEPGGGDDMCKETAYRDQAAI